MNRQSDAPVSASTLYQHRLVFTPFSDSCDESGIEQNRNRRVFLGLKGDLHVDAFGTGHGLEVRCLQCGHAGVIEAEQLEQKFPPHARIKDIEFYFRCIRCKKLEKDFWYPVELRDV